MRVMFLFLMFGTIAAGPGRVGRARWRGAGAPCLLGFIRQRQFAGLKEWVEFWRVNLVNITYALPLYRDNRRIFKTHSAG